MTYPKSELRSDRRFSYCSFAYSAFAALYMGMSASASFQSSRNCLYSANARTRAASASAPLVFFDCSTLTRAIRDGPTLLRTIQHHVLRNRSSKSGRVPANFKVAFRSKFSSDELGSTVSERPVFV